MRNPTCTLEMCRSRQEITGTSINYSRKETHAGSLPRSEKNSNAEGAAEVAAAGSEIHPTMEKVAPRLTKAITGTLRVQMSGAVEEITDLKVDLARSSKKKD